MVDRTDQQKMMDGLYWYEIPTLFRCEHDADGRLAQRHHQLPGDGRHVRDHLAHRGRRQGLMVDPAGRHRRVVSIVAA